MPLMNRPTTFLFLSAFCAMALLASPARAADKVDFNREIRPLLSSKCFQCHGPDEKARKSKLRLDLQEFATKPAKSGEIAIVPGKPDQSELVKRISTHDEVDVMPPPKTSAPLTARQIATLRAWIEQGAEYAQHWAYVKPVRHEPPAVKDAAWPVNAIDRFVLSQLEKDGLHPTPATDRYALIRRLSIDLTGLPPTIQEADDFARDASPNAYETLVDRLLAQPAYVERWAPVWLEPSR